MRDVVAGVGETGDHFFLSLLFSFNSESVPGPGAGGGGGGDNYASTQLS